MPRFPLRTKLILLGGILVIFVACLVLAAVFVTMKFNSTVVNKPPASPVAEREIAGKSVQVTMKSLNRELSYIASFTNREHAALTALEEVSRFRTQNARFYKFDYVANDKIDIEVRSRESEPVANWSTALINHFHCPPQNVFRRQGPRGMWEVEMRVDLDPAPLPARGKRGASQIDAIIRAHAARCPAFPSDEAAISAGYHELEPLMEKVPSLRVLKLHTIKDAWALVDGVKAVRYSIAASGPPECLPDCLRRLNSPAPYSVREVNARESIDRSSREPKVEFRIILDGIYRVVP